MFDRIVVVDWSAHSAPKRGADSIWMCALDTGTGAVELSNHPTRAEAREALVAVAALPGRTLVGVDFPIGYPAGLAAAAGLGGAPAPWAAMWAHLAGSVRDDERNGNNRFAVAAELNERLGRHQFWGAPLRAAGPHLPPRKPAAPPLPPFRLVEQRLRAAGRSPFSCWQLLGAGSVGSQALTGIPVLRHVRHHPALRGRARVWPFETGPHPTAADGALLAEVWPSMVTCDHIDHPVKDARQVVALAHWLAEPSNLAVPELGADEARAVLDEEGWVLGVP